MLLTNAGIKGPYVVALSTNSRLIVVPSGHAVHFEQPALVVESIREVVDAARTGQPLKQ